ncbi:MAG: hypothetical protein OXI91_14955 [Chloroflexota bacterium]|nr:hypothetical protein [Chloroflexota bacterium]
MREHEVPTHVQAEDKALLWFTFPQIVAVVATCAVAYGVYRYFPLGPSGLKLGIAVLLGVVGMAMTVGKVGGRGLPLVAADLLKFNLGARRYAGSPAELAISEPPPQPEAKPDPLRLLAKKVASGVGRAVKAARQKGRRPFRPHSWFGKGRRSRNADANRPRTQGEDRKEKKPWGRLLAVGALGLLMVVLLPGSALADDPDDNPYGDAWRLGEIYFEPPDPVPGRRVYVERLAVSGNTAAVTLRAAHDLDLKGRVFGGRTGRTLKIGFNTSLAAGQSKSYNLTLNGPSPSFTFSWQDSLGRSGAASLKSHQIPYPLPSAGGELCGLELTSLEWTPGRITGVIASECITETRHEEDLPVYGGHFSQSVPALLDADVTGITGTVTVAWGGHSTTAAFVRDGETAFTLPVANNRAVSELAITAELTATLNVPRPPVLQTVHHPARTDVYTRRVTCRCGESSTVRTVRIYVHHPEHVRAVENQRSPVTRTRTESVPLAPPPASGTGPALGLGADAPYQALHVPPPPPPPPKAEQTPVGGSNWWSWLWPGN